MDLVYFSNITNVNFVEFSLNLLNCDFICESDLKFYEHLNLSWIQVRRCFWENHLGARGQK
jgi:hypothetical protein